MRPVIAVLGLLVSTNLASAADLGGHYDQYGGSLKDAPIVVAPLTWTGLYVGAHAGWVTGGWAGNMEYSGTSPDGWIFDDSTKKLKDNDWGGDYRSASIDNMVRLSGGSRQIFRGSILRTAENLKRTETILR